MIHKFFLLDYCQQKQILTKRLKFILQKIFFHHIVYKKIIIFLISVTYCSSINYIDDIQTIRKNQTIFIKAKLKDDFKEKECSEAISYLDWYLLLYQKDLKNSELLFNKHLITKSILSKTKRDFHRIKNLRELQKKKKICLKKIKSVHKYEKELFVHLWKFYFLNLENELNLWMIKNEFPEQQRKEILMDINEISRSIIDIYKYYLFFLSEMMVLDHKDWNKNENEIQKKIFRLNETYYTLIYHFFYHLPESYKKEWLKKNWIFPK